MSMLCRARFSLIQWRSVLEPADIVVEEVEDSLGEKATYMLLFTHSIKQFCMIQL